MYKQKLSVYEGTLVYSQLKKDVEEVGILDRDYFFYFWILLFVFCGFLTSAFFIIISKNPFAIILSGLSFAFFSVQLGGLFHDSGHRAVFRSTKNNDILGHICCALVVYPFTNWKNLHNKHHAKPNQEDNDPDVEVPFLAFTQKTLKKKKGIPKFLSKYQAFIYLPLSFTTAIFFQTRDITYLRKYAKRLPFWEAFFYVVGLITWLIFPVLFFGLAKAVLVYLSVYPLMGFYLYNVFAPNHKGMPQLEKKADLSFLEHQISTTRNIKGGIYYDFIYMGLNYQMEHHLFPHCPRNKLKLITPYLKKLCANTNLEYTETGVIESNKIIISELNNIAKFA